MNYDLYVRSLMKPQTYGKAMRARRDAMKHDFQNWHKDPELSESWACIYECWWNITHPIESVISSGDYDGDYPLG